VIRVILFRDLRAGRRHTDLEALANQSIDCSPLRVYGRRVHSDAAAPTFFLNPECQTASDAAIKERQAEREGGPIRACAQAQHIRRHARSTFLWGRRWIAPTEPVREMSLAGKRYV
jgi:hypothetical protein